MFLIILTWALISALYLCIYFMGIEKLTKQWTKNALAVVTFLFWIGETGLCVYYAM